MKLSNYYLRIIFRYSHISNYTTFQMNNLLFKFPVNPFSRIMKWV